MIPPDVTDKGAGWVRGYLLGVAYPLGLVEVSGEHVRLSAFGRYLLLGDAEPPAPPAFPQTLLVQPNAEVLAYRQGLTPALIAALSRFAAWKGIGPACTLELTPEQTYRGLESGLTLPMIVQTLNRHGTRPVPAGVVDLLQRWASKRERITIFSSAVLVEFQTPAELDIAVSRGVVALALTDRIGMTADGGEPSLSHLRLVGNRDYESKPQRLPRDRRRRRDAHRRYAASRPAPRSGDRAVRGSFAHRPERRAEVPAHAGFPPARDRKRPAADGHRRVVHGAAAGRRSPRPGAAVARRRCRRRGRCGCSW